MCGKFIDEVWIDGPCELLIRRSKDKLLAGRTFRKFPGSIVLQTFECGNSRCQLYCICTIPLGPIFKWVMWLKSSSKTPANVLEPHGQSMNTLSMGKSKKQDNYLYCPNP